MKEELSKSELKRKPEFTGRGAEAAALAATCNFLNDPRLVGMEDKVDAPPKVTAAEILSPKPVDLAPTRARSFRRHQRTSKRFSTRASLA